MIVNSSGFLPKQKATLTWLVKNNVFLVLCLIISGIYYTKRLLDAVIMQAIVGCSLLAD